MDPPTKKLISLLENELTSSDNRYLNLRTQLLETLTSNAQLIEYIQYIEDQLSFYKQKVLFNDKKTQIESSHNTLPLNLILNDNPVQIPQSEHDANINHQTGKHQNDENEPQKKSKPHIQRQKSVTIIKTIQQFNDIMAQNSDTMNTKIFNNLQMYQKLVNLLSNQPLKLDYFLSSICSILSFDAASIYSISHSLQKISCEMSTLSHLNKNYSSEINQGFLAQIVKHKRTIIIRDVNETNFAFNAVTDDRFYGLDIEQAGGRQTVTVILEPLFNDNQEMIGILELVNTEKKDQDYGNNVFYNILKLSRNIASILLSEVLIQREYTNSNIHKEALLELAKVMSNNANNKNNIENLIEKVRKTVYKSVKCDKVALFMVDEIRQELWCNASDDVAGLRLPLSKGIVGHTVTTGECLNIIDAYQDSRFNPAVDKRTNYRTKTILCVPIKYNNKIIGAMECINKANDECFTEADVILLNKMAEETAPSLQNKFMESALRIISQGLQDSSSRDYLSQFMRNEDYMVSSAKDDGGKQGKNVGVDNDGDSKRVVSLQNDNASGLYVRISNSIKNEDICTWDFDYFKLMEDNYQTAIPMMVYMFNDFDLLQAFNIDERKLYSFLVAVKQHYYDNPYHNFLHAFSVMHVCYLILKKTSWMNRFNELDVLTIFIAAVCHDLEHPGLTNAYQVNSGSDLAMRYNDKSVLENHHAHIGSVLLKKPEMCILDGLTSDEMNKVRKSMINIILHTDMSYHQDIVTKLLQFSTASNNVNNMSSTDSSSESDSSSSASTIFEDKQFLCETLVHLGDLSNPVMRWDQSHEWSLRVIDEFIAQSKLEKEQNLKVSMTFITDKSPAAVSKVQTSFIDYVVKPLWKNAAYIAPELSERISVLDKNRENWNVYPTKSETLKK